MLRNLFQILLFFALGSYLSALLVAAVDAEESLFQLMLTSQVFIAAAVGAGVALLMGIPLIKVARSDRLCWVSAIVLAPIVIVGVAWLFFTINPMFHSRIYAYKSVIMLFGAHYTIILPLALLTTVGSVAWLRLQEKKSDGRMVLIYIIVPALLGFIGFHLTIANTAEIEPPAKPVTDEMAQCCLDAYQFLVKEEYLAKNGVFATIIKAEELCDKVAQQMCDEKAKAICKNNPTLCNANTEEFCRAECPMISSCINDCRKQVELCRQSEARDDCRAQHKQCIQKCPEPIAF